MDVALKVTYNDGNKGRGMGFKGVCSEQNIKHNISEKRINCSLSDNPCKTYYDSGFKGKRPATNTHCYEANLFSDWKFGAGMYHNGKNKGKAIPIKKVAPGDLAILTTRLPGTEERERKIIGLLRIDKIDDPNVDNMGYMLVAHSNLRIELSEEIATQLNFWDYHKSLSGTPNWHEGLFRYLERSETQAILIALYEVLMDWGDKKIIQNLMPISKGKKVIPKPLSDPFVKQVLLGRKYGPRGEGEEHRELKRWVANNPGFLGLPSVEEKQVEEHRFISSDLPDIVFKTKDGWVVVEIETYNTWPGAYQAIKYKALLCAEQGLVMSDSSVRSFLVAYSIPDEVRKFCSKYSIETKIKSKALP